MESQSSSAFEDILNVDAASEAHQTVSISTGEITCKEDFSVSGPEAPTLISGDIIEDVIDYDSIEDRIRACYTKKTSNNDEASSSSLSNQGVMLVAPVFSKNDTAGKLESIRGVEYFGTSSDEENEENGEDGGFSDVESLMDKGKGKEKIGSYGSNRERMARELADLMKENSEEYVIQSLDALKTMGEEQKCFNMRLQFILRNVLTYMKDISNRQILIEARLDSISETMTTPRDNEKK
jgi:hypothetical protein